MENKDDKCCPLAVFPYSIGSEKPEKTFETEEKTNQAQLGAPKKQGQLPWSVFEDVLWI